MKRSFMRLFLYIAFVAPLRDVCVVSRTLACIGGKGLMQGKKITHDLGTIETPKQTVTKINKKKNTNVHDAGCRLIFGTLLAESGGGS